MPRPSWDVAAFSVSTQRLYGDLRICPQLFLGLGIPPVVVRGLALISFPDSCSSFDSRRHSLLRLRLQVFFRLVGHTPFSLLSSPYFSPCDPDIRLRCHFLFVFSRGRTPWA
ncbi:hypothetical protein NDU88_009268 [Pleurodeles waltl]|uniref:Uncharacterized protein n=1 Tax=Pleurodeles waltl TaxID=8319 RepID=A0AAV7NYJ2_PLEWA|nr:hypothetical protein NDU88_009268 [Pleurodeles waltl]